MKALQGLGSEQQSFILMPLLWCEGIHPPFKHKLVLSDARHYSAVLDPAELPPSPTSPSTAPQEKMAQTEQLIFESVVKET